MQSLVFIKWFVCVCYRTDPWQDLKDDYGKGGYERITNLRQTNPHLKVINWVNCNWWPILIGALFCRSRWLSVDGMKAPTTTQKWQPMRSVASDLWKVPRTLCYATSLMAWTWTGNILRNGELLHGSYAEIDTIYFMMFAAAANRLIKTISYCSPRI